VLRARGRAGGGREARMRGASSVPREGGLPPWVLDPAGGLVMADGEGAQATPRHATGDAPVILSLGEEVEEVRGRGGKSTHMMGMMEEAGAMQSTCTPRRSWRGRTAACGSGAMSAVRLAKR